MEVYWPPTYCVHGILLAATDAATVNSALPDIVPEVALMVAVPAVTPVARPLALTVATGLELEAQVMPSVNNVDVPSEKVPVAVNCCATPGAINGLAGVTVIAASVAVVTVKVMLAEKPEKVALMVVLPAVTLVTTPLLSTVAMPLADEAQVTAAINAADVPSE